MSFITKCLYTVHPIILISTPTILKSVIKKIPSNDSTQGILKSMINLHCLSKLHLSKLYLPKH